MSVIYLTFALFYSVYMIGLKSKTNFIFVFFFFICGCNINTSYVCKCFVNIH